MVRIRESLYVPEQGDIVWLDFNPQKGHEQSGVRPALVLSPSLYNKKTGLAIFCPLTTQIKGYPFEVLLPPGLKATGAILVDHVKNLDWRSRQARFCDKIPKTLYQQVIQKLTRLIS